MSKGKGVSVLLGAVVVLWCIGAGGAQNSSSVSDMLDGREVAIRVFPDWENDRWVYDMVVQRLEGDILRFDISQAGHSSSAVGVLLRSDQSDDFVKSYVDSDAQIVRSGSEVKLRHRSGRSIAMCFLDGPAHPVAFATGEVFKRVGDEGEEKIMSRFLLDEQGKTRWRYTTSKTTKYYVRVRHPYYGEWSFSSPLNKSGYTWRIPMAQPGTEAYERSIRGVIINDANEPLEGVLLQVERLCAPGGKYLYARGSVRTDDEGFFHMYPVMWPESRAAFGDMIPARSCYEAWIEPPRESGMMAGYLCIPNAGPFTLLAARGKFHTFAFEDGGRRITKAAGIEAFRLLVDRPNRNQQTYQHRRFAKGLVLAPGTYSIADWGLKYEFDPVVVTDESPEEIVFRTKVASSDVVRYTGTVVDGATGDLIEGAYVVASNTGLSPHRGSNFSEFTPEEWDKLRGLPVSFSVRKGIADVMRLPWHSMKDLSKVGDVNEFPVIEDAILPVHRLWDISKGVRTDSNGRFEIEFERDEKFERLVFFEEGYLSIILKKFSLFDDGDGEVDVGTVPLFPAAKVIVNPKVIGGRTRIIPQWILDSNDCPDWACGSKRIMPDLDTLDDPAAFEKFLAEAAEAERREIRCLTSFAYGRWKNFGYSQDITPDKKKVVHVPAGVRLRLYIGFVLGSKHEWTPYTYPQKILLKKGETLDLGACEIHKSIHVYVKVVDSAGKPVEGIPVEDPVGEMHASGQFWIGNQGRHATDWNGLVRFNVYRNMKGKFRIGCERHRVEESLEFEVGDEADEGREFVFQISDGLRTHMLGDGK